MLQAEKKWKDYKIRPFFVYVRKRKVWDEKVRVGQEIKQEISFRGKGCEKQESRYL